MVKNMKKYKKGLVLIGITSVVGTAASSNLVNLQTNIKYSKNEAKLASLEEFNDTEYRKIRLSSLKLNKQLGGVKNSNPDELLKRFLELNKDSTLTENDIEIKTKETTIKSTVIKAKSTSAYSGEFAIYFDIRTPLSDVLKNIKIGFLPNNTETFILNETKNRNLSLKKMELEVRDIKLDSAVIGVKSSSESYAPYDSVRVEYSIPPQSFLEHFTWEKNQLLAVVKNDEKSIRASLKREFGDLDLNEVKIEADLYSNHFTIEPKIDSKKYRFIPAIRVETRKAIRKNLMDFPKSLDIKNHRDHKGFLDIYGYNKGFFDSLIYNTVVPFGGEDCSGFDYEYKIEERDDKNRYLIISSTEDSVGLSGSCTILLQKVHVSQAKMSELARNSMRGRKHVYLEPSLRKSIDIPNAISLKELRINFTQELKKYIEEKYDLIEFLDSNDNTIEALWLIGGGSTYNWTKKFGKEDITFFKRVELLPINTLLRDNIRSVFNENIIIDGIRAPKDWSGNKLSVVDDVPHYDEGILSYIDSTGDTEYEKLSGFYLDSDHINKYHKVKQQTWQTVDMVIGKIDYKDTFGYTSVYDFFNDYYFKIDYDYKAGAWNGKDKWFNGHGKGSNFHVQSTSINSYSDLRKIPPHGGQKTSSGENWRFLEGTMKGTFKEVGAVAFYGELTGTTITLHGMVGTWYNWNWASTVHHAAFSYMSINNVAVISK